MDWKEVFRRGFAPQISDQGLTALKHALEMDDKKLIQGATCLPSSLECVHDFPVEGACAISFCGWQGEKLGTVQEVEEYFADACRSCDDLLDEFAGCRWFLNAYDESPRELMFRELLAEVNAELERRGVLCPQT